jgi:hypothetical protein
VYLLGNSGNICSKSLTLRKEGMKRNWDLISSLCWIVVGLLFCVRGGEYGFLHLGTLGPGFFPFTAGLILVFLSLLLLVSSIRRKTGGDEPIGAKRFFPERDSWKRLLLALLSLLGYIFCLKYLGFLTTTFLFMVFLLRFIEPQKWVTVLVAAILTSTISYVIFRQWLEVQLPTGILGL